MKSKPVYTNGPNIISQFWKKCLAEGYVCLVTQQPPGHDCPRYEAYIRDPEREASFVAYGDTQSAACREVMRKAGIK